MKLRLSFFQFLPVVCLLTTTPVSATEYQVGPGKKLASIGEVPWESLAPGDHVLIYGRPEPYREKWVITRRGTAQQPIIVRGVPGTDGQLPVIDGENAVTARSPGFWGEARSILKIGGSDISNGAPPEWILVENLDLHGAKPPFGFEGRKAPGKYVANASAIWIENGDHITVRGCTLHDSANGLCTSNQSRNVVIERCHIYGNGLVKSIHQHNVYTESQGLIFQYNWFGPLNSNCLGNNLKDRSAGLVVRYNWIEGGSRELDLVDADDSPVLRNDPAYRKTFVYGNAIIKTENDPGIQVVHYGGDMGKPDLYRKGTLYFYNNTVVSRQRVKTTLFRIQTNDEHVDCRNNILFVTAAPKGFAISDSVGQVELFNNWINAGWVSCHGKLTGSVTASGSIEGRDPGFVNEGGGDFHLTDHSPCRKAGTGLAPGLTSEDRASDEYVPNQNGKPRSDTGGAPDLGAFSSKNSP